MKLEFSVQNFEKYCNITFHGNPSNVIRVFLIKKVRTGPRAYATSTSLLGSFTCRKARHGTDGFTSPPKEGVLRISPPEKSDCFGRV
jgi:hypothetical protein